jgi:DNA or RNA helicases of superfamily II
LVLVHSVALLEQWHERLSQFLDVKYQEPEDKPKKRGRKKAFSPIGCFDSKRDSLHGVIDIALMQSCIQDGEIKPFVKDYGMVIVDECHHVPSVTYELVVKNLKAQTVYGLTATPIRKDGHQPIIFMQFGPIRFVADAKAQMDKQSFQRYLIPRFTSFRELSDNKETYTSLLPKLAEDELRNQLMCDDIIKVVRQGRTPIILTKLVSHVGIIASMLAPHIKNVIRLTGVGKTTEKREAMQHLLSIPKEEPLAIVATGSYVGEGFDYPRLDTLFLALPISWKGIVQQYVGRLHREFEGKKDVRVYDYIDINVPLFNTMYHRRLKGYSGAGYRVISKDSQSIFGDIADIQDQQADGQIFNGKTFFRIFRKDIAMAKSSIVISSPKLYLANKIELLNALRELSIRGIVVTILTSKESEHTELAQRKGLDVHIVHELSLCCCIFDKTILWYGDVNFLGYSSEENNVIKVDDKKLANEILGVLFKCQTR